MDTLHLEVLDWSLLDDFDHEMRAWNGEYDNHHTGTKYGNPWDVDVKPSTFNTYEEE
jgi:hypothetical protein